MRERDRKRVTRHRSRLDEQRAISEKLYDELFAFVNGSISLDSDLDALRAHLRTKLAAIVRGYKQGKPPSLRNWTSFSVRRTVSKGVLREIPDESNHHSLYTYALYELFNWEVAKDVRVCACHDCGRFFLVSETYPDTEGSARGGTDYCTRTCYTANQSYLKRQQRRAKQALPKSGRKRVVKRGRKRTA